MEVIKKLNSLLVDSQRIWEEDDQEESIAAQDQFDQLFEELHASLEPALIPSPSSAAI